MRNAFLCSVIDAPWYQPGADPADFFNYGLNPRTWKEYCAQIQKFQTEFTMQRQIEVYDKDGRARGGNSDLPPELAAAVAQKRAAEGPNKPYQVHSLCLVDPVYLRPTNRAPCRLTGSPSHTLVPGRVQVQPCLRA